MRKVPRHNIGEANYTPETGVLAGVIPTPMRTGKKHESVTAQMKDERKASNVVSTSKAVGVMPIHLYFNRIRLRSIYFLAAIPRATLRQSSVSTKLLL